MPGVGTSCTSPLVTQGKKYYFAPCFIDPYQGAAAASYAYKTLGMKKAAILMDVANDYSVGLCSFFKRSYKKLGGQIVADMKYNSGDQDFTAKLTEIINQKPDIVFMPAYFAEGAINEAGPRTRRHLRHDGRGRHGQSRHRQDRRQGRGRLPAHHLPLRRQHAQHEPRRQGPSPTHGRLPIPTRIPT